MQITMRYSNAMKIVKENTPRTRGVTLRISEETMKKIDKIAEENDLSRQALIEAILEQVISDKNFVVRI